MKWVGMVRGGRGGLNSNVNRTDACLDVDMRFLSISIASNDGVGQHGDIHSSIALSCNREQMALCMAMHTGF